MTGLEIKLELVRQRRSQYELARAAGLEPTRLNRILNGWVEPRPCELATICVALNLKEDLSKPEQVNVA